MLKKITNLKSEDVFMLTSFANMDLGKILTGKLVDENNLKYENLLKDSALPENKDVQMEVDTIIDDLMFDNYSIYFTIKENEKKTTEINLDGFDDNIKEIFLESQKSIKRYINLYEDLLINTKFEFPHIRQIQKYFLEEKIKEEILVENYEKCAELQKRINEI